MDEAYLSDNRAYLVRLQVPDEMPVDRDSLKQWVNIFFEKLLDVTFSKLNLSGIVCLTDKLSGFCFGNSNQANTGGIPSRLNARPVYLFPYCLNIGCNALPGE